MTHAANNALRCARLMDWRCSNEEHVRLIKKLTQLAGIVTHLARQFAQWAWNSYANGGEKSVSHNLRVIVWRWTAWGSPSFCECQQLLGKKVLRLHRKVIEFEYFTIFSQRNIEFLWLYVTSLSPLSTEKKERWRNLFNESRCDAAKEEELSYSDREQSRRRLIERRMFIDK